MANELCSYSGVPHAFHLSYPQFKVAQQFEKDLKEGVKWMLDGANDQYLESDGASAEIGTEDVQI